MLVQSFKNIQTFYPPCRPGEAQWINLTASLDVDISEVFPFLNATIQGAIYDPNSRTIAFKLKGHAVTLHPQQVAVTKSENPAEAKQALEKVKELINATYRDRGSPAAELQETGAGADPGRLQASAQKKLRRMRRGYLYGLRQ